MPRVTVEIDGYVRMRGDTGPGVRVQVLADDQRLRIVSGNELVGDWRIDQIGIHALHEGFTVRAEGEEFVLVTDDDVALADAIHVSAASPRLARRLAARHNPETPPEPDELTPPRSNLGAIGFALAGALVLLGGTLLNIEFGGAARNADEGFGFWLAFVVGGVLMVGAAWVMSIGARPAHLIATILLVAMVVVFGILVSSVEASTTELTAYGFIAGGLVVGVAVLFSGSVRSSH